MKALRYVLWGLLGLIVIVVAVVAIALWTINPNDYKPQIEKVVESHTNLNLQLKGDIGWSLIPIGLKLNDVQANLEGKPFIKVKRLVAQIDFWSLLGFQPAVNTFVLDGLDANLTKNRQGQGNWERIVPEGKTTAGSSGQPAPAKTQPPAKTAAGSGKPLQFNVHDVSIVDAHVNYTDQSTGQSVDLNKVNLNASGIAPGKTFPLKLSFKVANAKPKLDVDGKLSAKIRFDDRFQQFAVSDLTSNFDLRGTPFGDKTVNAGVDGNVSANLKDEQADIQSLKLHFANVKVDTSAKVQGFKTPKVSGKLAIAPFSPQQLLADMGQPPIKTRDDKVLQKVALNTDLTGPAGDIQLKPFTLTLDSTVFKGDLQYRLKNSFIGVNLHGNALDLDSYLPPKAKKTKGTGGDSGAAAGKAQSAPEQDLLPLKTIRSLAFDVKLALDKLTASNLKISDIKMDATGNQGLINVKQVSGKLYQGSFTTTASLDARRDNPVWKLHENLSGVQTLPLLTDLAKLKSVSGAVNAKADVNTTGNRISALRSNAKGQASFNIDKGAFHGFNLNAMACEGIARINKEDIKTGDWPDQTTFNTLKGVVQINGNTLNNTNLSAQLAGLDLGGQGKVNLQQMDLNYELGLKVVGDVAKDKACRVNPRVQGLVIPVKCEGNLTGGSKSLCRFDTSKFADVARQALEKAGKERLQKELNKGLNKLLNKNGGSNQKDSGSQNGGTLQDKLKGLFQ